MNKIEHLVYYLTFKTLGTGKCIGTGTCFIRSSLFGKGS